MCQGLFYAHYIFISFNPSQQLYDTVTSVLIGEENESAVTGIRSLVADNRARSQTCTQTLVRDPQAHSHPPLQQTRLLPCLVVSIVKHRVLLHQCSGHREQVTGWLVIPQASPLTMEGWGQGGVSGDEVLMDGRRWVLGRDWVAEVREPDNCRPPFPEG